MGRPRDVRNNFYQKEEEEEEEGRSFVEWIKRLTRVVS